MVNVTLEDVRKYFGKVKAVDGISLKVKNGEFIVLLGPSGCGKTTLLRTIAGLERVTSGRIFFDEDDVTYLPPRARNVSMVFQSYAVFPHMSVYDNIAFPLKIKKYPKQEIKRRVKWAAELLRIDNLLSRYPNQLSGGQRQRVAVARAIVVEPKLLLMDEPLSNLDALLRVKMRSELKKLQKAVKVTTIYVTHDQVEAMTMGDRIAVMKEGKLQQVGTPSDIYHRPSNLFVAGFIGSPQMNFVKGMIAKKEGNMLFDAGDLTFRIPDELVSVLEKYEGEELTAGIRPENIYLSFLTLESTETVKVKAKIDFVETLGSETILHCKIGNTVIISKVSKEVNLKVGDDVQIELDARKLHFFDKRGEAII